MSTQPEPGGLMRAFATRLSELSYDNLDPVTIIAAKDRILDALGVTCNGLAEPVASVARASVGESRGRCTIVGRSIPAGMSDAAFANAVTGHATLQEDLGGGGHPGTYIVPVVLAVAEEYGRSGQQVLAALAIGYEAADRMGRAVPPNLHARGFRAVPAIGVFGAAAAAAMLMDLDTTRLASALDLVAHMAGGLYQPFADGTMEGYFHAGFAARSGITAALLARAGARTSPLSLEGCNGFFNTYGSGLGDAGALLAPITGELALSRVRSKPFPACALNQDTMLMIRALRPADLHEQQIERLVLRRPATGLNSFAAPGVANDPPYANMLQAQMSAKFTAAAALLGRPVTDLAYFRDWFADGEVESLAQRTVLASNDGEAIVLEIFLREGTCLRLNATDVHDMRWDTHAVAERFPRLAGPVLGNAIASIRDCVAQLDAAADVRELLRLVREAAPDLSCPC
jgi:2-methylcitrate dehydratase PrpD